MSLIQGLIAGYGIAIPVGAIAVLIVGVGLRKGFWVGFMAGAGAASADLLFAALAAIAGQLLGDILAPIQLPLRLASAALLVSIGGYGLWKLQQANSVTERTIAHTKKRQNLFPISGSDPDESDDRGVFCIAHTWWRRQGLNHSP